jgi:hypothetical protein
MLVKHCRVVEILTNGDGDTVQAEKAAVGVAARDALVVTALLSSLLDSDWHATGLNGNGSSEDNGDDLGEHFELMEVGRKDSK